MSKADLKLDWATHKAAKYACERWHYSKTIPSFKRLKVGAWENGKFIGVLIFSQGATPEIGKPYGLPQIEICELTRVALGKHNIQTSRIIAVALKFLRRNCPKIRLVVSFADETQGHHGGIYQAGGWIYTGKSETHTIFVHGIHEHPKTLYLRYGIGGQSIPWLKANVDSNAKRVNGLGKYRYLMPLDAEMREKIVNLSKPYPKRTKHAMTETIGTAAVKHRPVRSTKAA